MVPGKEILLPVGSDDVERYITGYDDAELKKIGRAAQQRVLAAHTSAVRAHEFEQIVEATMKRDKETNVTA